MRVSSGGVAQHVGQGRPLFHTTSSHSRFHLIDLEEGKKKKKDEKRTIYVQIGICVRVSVCFTLRLGAR